MRWMRFPEAHADIHRSRSTVRPYFFSLMSTEARVFSQSTCMAQVEPVWSKAMVKFSIGEDSCDTRMSTRVKSSPSPG